MAETKQITFTVNAKTLELIDQLKKELGVDSTAAVLRRALALARLAAANAQEDNTVVILDRKGQQNKVMLDA